MKVLKDFLIGFGHDPRIVAAVRALVVFLLPFAVAGAINALTHWLSGTQLAEAAVLGAVLLRAAEGYVLDYLNKPHQNIVPVDHISA